MAEQQRKSWIRRRIENGLRRGFQHAYETVKVDPATPPQPKAEGSSEADDAVAADARAEATALAPDLAAQAPATRLPVERRLDLAYELIQGGNLDAGIDQLQAVVRAYPNNPQAAQMLAQALVRLGTDQTQSHDYDGARESFTVAVSLYARLLPCDGARCDSSELELAHRNRILSSLDAQRFDAARAALAEAEAIGLQFPDLKKRWPELAAPAP